MIKTYLFLVLGFGYALTLQSQQLAVFSQHSEQMSYSNPAHLGYQYLVRDNDLTVSALYSKQWVKQTYSPQTQFIDLSYCNKYNNALHPLLGGNIINDQTGPISYTGLYGRVGAVFSPDPDEYGVSIAFSGGAVNYRIDADKIFLREDNDILGSTSQSVWFPDVNIGVFFYKGFGYRNDNNVYIGVGANQLFGLDLKYEKGENNFSYQRLQHLNMKAGSYFSISDEAIIHPSVSVKYVKNSPISVGIGMEYIYDNLFSLKANYASGQDIGIGTGINLGEAWDWGFDCFFNYTFGIPLNEFSPSLGSAHVIGISYGINQD